MSDSPFSMPLTPEQDRAVDLHRRWLPAQRGMNAAAPTFRIDGYAGTGKTYLLPYLLEDAQKHGLAPLVCTPTGKAAARARKFITDQGMSGVAVMTVHKATSLPIVEVRGDGTEKLVRFDLKADAPAACCDIVYVDETSMLGDGLAERLRVFGKPIVLIGDPAQLPPVNEASILTTGRPDVMLTTVLRHTGPLLALAHRVRLGQATSIPQSWASEDVVLSYDRRWREDVVEHARQRRIAIAGRHVTRYDITALIRGSGAPFLPRPGEPLLVERNSSMRPWLHNGLELVAASGNDDTDLCPRISGMLRSVFPPDPEDTTLLTTKHDLKVLEPLLEDGMTVDIFPIYLRCFFAQHFKSKAIYTGPTGEKKIWEGERGNSAFHEIEEVSYGWVLTCHKAQGLEWPHVVVINEAGRFFGWNWLYTAVTRAQNKLWIYNAQGR